MGTHVIPMGAAVPAPAVDAPLISPVRPAIKMSVPKQRPKKPAMRKVAKRPAKNASLVAINEAAAVAPTGRYKFFFSPRFNLGEFELLLHIAEMSQNPS
jgi:hypothetical protein